MLTKLIRHEFRATSRIMWPIFAGMLALTLAMRASQRVLQNDFPWLLNLLAVLVTIGFVFGIMALCFAPLVLSAVRFRDHLLKDEGYLTLTLPVNMHQLLASKLIVSAVWYAAAFLAVVLLCMIGAFDFSDWRVVPAVRSRLPPRLPQAGQLDAGAGAALRVGVLPLLRPGRHRRFPHRLRGVRRRLQLQ